MKKLIVLFLVLVLSLALAACGRDNDDDTPPPVDTEERTGPDNNEAPPEEPPVVEPNVEPLRFTATVKSHGGDDDNSMIQQAWLELMEELMGRPIEITFDRIMASEFDQIVELRLQTDDIADFQQLPSFYNRAQIDPEIIVDIGQYQHLLTNYLNIIDQLPGGRSRIINPEGRIDAFIETSSPRLPSDMGMSVFAVFVYNWTVMQNHDLSIPTTTEELYEVASRLKEIYPDSYPVNTRWNGFWSVWHMHHTDNQVFWNGSEFLLGQITENYRNALRFLNRLHESRLLDPEWLIESDDTYRSKLFNRINFISLYEWYSDPGGYTRNNTNGDIFAISFYPDTELYGTSFQHVQDLNNYSLGWDAFVISTRHPEREALIKFADLQYHPAVVELLNWGIEGVTFTRDENGERVFVDDIRLAENPYLAADSFGIQNSTQHRPGLQLAMDPTAHIGLALNDWVFFDGQVHEVPLNQSRLVREIPFPNDIYIAPWNGIRAPVIQLTTEERQAHAEIMTPINTFRDEMMVAFINGSACLDADWDDYVNSIYSLGDFRRVLDDHNAAAERFFAGE